MCFAQITAIFCALFFLKGGYLILAIDYSAKAEVLSNGRFDDWLDAYTSAMRIYYGLSPFPNSLYQTTEEALYRLSWIKFHFDDDYKECFRLYNSKKARSKRLNKRVASMLQTDCVFCTLTFSDDVLERTSAKTRHDYVNRWLKNNFPCAIANIDFGKQNGREHYHALVCAEKVVCSSWKYGSINFEVVRNRKSNTSDKLATYVSKLTFHSIKATTKGSRVIYSGDMKGVARKYDILHKPNSVSQRVNSPSLALADSVRKQRDEMNKRWFGSEKGYMSEKAILEMLDELFKSADGVLAVPSAQGFSCADEEV